MLWRPSAGDAAPLWLSAILFLPWIPAQLPTSVFFWAGGLRLWLWGAIAAMIAVANLRAPLRSLRAVNGSRPRDAVFVAWVSSAVLFGASTPFAKLLVETSNPQLLAGLLYLGAGVGLAIVQATRSVLGLRNPAAAILVDH